MIYGQKTGLRECSICLDEMPEWNGKLGFFDYLLHEIQVVGTPGRDLVLVAKVIFDSQLSVRRRIQKKQQKGL